MSARGRHERWLLTIASLLLAACSGRVLDPVLWQDAAAPDVWAGDAKTPLTFTQTFPALPPTALDVLFVIDNSKGMEAYMGALPDAAKAFVATVRESGPLDLRVAVVTTDMGIGAVPAGVPGCTKLPSGDAAALQTGPAHPFVWDQPTGSWNRGTVTACPITGSFLAEPPSADSTTFSGTFEDALACALQVGVGGCPIKQPLAAAVEALIRNQDSFLRPSAQLAVVVVTDDDDCSLPPESGLMDPTSTSLEDTLGPLTSYRCNVFGHLCDGQPPPVRPPDVHTWPYHPARCTSNNSQGLLTQLEEISSRLQGFKRAVSMVSLAVIAGPPTSETGESRYSVDLDHDMAVEAGYANESWPKVLPACEVPNSGRANPAVRLKELTEILGAHGSFDTICGNSLVPQFQSAARFVQANRMNRCLSRQGRVPTVIEQLDTGGAVEIRECGLLGVDEQTANVSTPCWTQVTDTSCKNGTKLVIEGNLEPGVIILN